jgi:hypothetical protein
MPEDRFSSARQRALRYRERAAEVRKQAASVANQELKNILLESAKLYEALAEQAGAQQSAKQRARDQDEQRGAD